MSAVTNRAFSRLASLLLAALLIFTAGVLSAPPARADDGGSLSGTVTDEAGSPVGSVWVTVYGYDAEYDYWDYRGSTSSSEDGIYEVTGLAAGDYKVQFMTEGASANVVGEWWDDAVSQDAATLVSVSAGSTTPGISPRLAPAGSLSGTVADEDDSSIGNVEVTVYGYNAVDDYWDHRGAAYTAEDGTYTVRGLPAGEYKIEFRTWDATVNVVGEWWDDAASQDEAALVAVSAGATTSGISPRLAAAGEVSGTVTDEDENPVGDVTVTVYSYDPENEYWAYRGYAHTAEDGTYTVKGLAAGEYKFDFWTGNATANVVGEWWDDAMSEATADVIAVSAGATTSGISPRLAAAGAVSGTVTDEDGNPVEGVNVYASGYDAANDYWEYRGQASTSEDGTYVVRGLPAGEYKIEFTTQYASANVVGEWWDDAASLDAATSISVTAGGTTDGISPQLAFAGAVSGTVEDEHGNPAQAVEVVAYVEDDDYWSWHSSTRSADDGTYLLSGLPANHYKLEFRTENASENLVSEWWDDAANEEQASTVTVASGTTTSGISPQLAAGGNITGKVTDQHGSGVPDISVNVSSSHPDSDFYAYGQSSDDGEYVVRGLPAGDYLVHFGGTDGVVGEWWDDARSQSDAKAVAVSAGSVTSNISPELAPTGRIAGVVSDESGNPVSGVEVRVALVGSTPFDGGERSDWTGEDGSYEVRGLSAGEYTVHFLTWEASQNVLDEWWDDAETKASSTTVTVKEGATTSGVSPQLANGGEISGTVVDGDGDPMKYFGVRAYLGDASTPTSYGHASEDGSFTIRGLRTGEYKLLFNGQNSSGPTLVEWWSNAADRSSALPVAVDDGGTTGGIAIVLGENDGSVVDSRSASLSGTVTDGLGQPVKNADVSISDASGRSGDGARTDASGNWRLGHMPSGDYKVAFRARIGGEVITQFWENASDFDSSTVIALTPSEQRTGINGILQRTPAPVLESSVPTVLGSARFGDVLSVAPGQWTEGTTFIYQWFADDAPINGATSASLALSAGEVGKQISVVVTGSKEGYSSVTRTAVSTAPVAPLMLTAAMPTISGTISVGSTITAKPGAWTEGTAFSYQWFADGHAISGATGSTYVITSAQVGKKLTVRVAGALTSYASVSVMSAATKAVVNPALSASVPTISGTVAVGSTVTAKPGTWTSATTFSYQWLADGVALSEATKATFVLTAAQKDKAIAVAVTGMKPGYATASKTSAKTAKVKTGTLSVATPTISGTVASGSTLTAKPGTWTSGTSFTYQWYADGKAISKATKSTVKLAAGQKAKKITVKVTGKKSGYTTVAKTSKASAKVVTVATPTISGTKTVGKTLTAKPGTWTSRTTFSYQWYANGKAISKATKSTLKLTTSHKGKAITVKVTGKKSGYATVAKTSEATAKVR